MSLKKGLKTGLLLALVFLIVFFLFPNIFNQDEREAFGEEERLEEARTSYPVEGADDSASIVPGPYFETGKLHRTVFGELSRKLWRVPVKAPILRLNGEGAEYDTIKFSGSQQTIGIDVEDADQRVWSIRSVNKDQAKALPGILQLSILRPMIRDQAAALNPYGALVVPVLAEAINVHHTNPGLYIFPYDESLNRYNNRMAGRLVLMEEEADESWNKEPEFRQALQLMDTEDMLDTARTADIPIDTMLYARSRLLDMLISDWDRHEGNWEWALIKEQGKPLFQPVPVDRDMAFYNYKDGAFTQGVLLVNNKFQSFTPEFADISGLMHQSEELDSSILQNLSQEKMVEQAVYIQNQLTTEVIHKAFMQYPPEVYKVTGPEHEQILQQRLQKLPEAARQFYQLLQKK